MDTLIKTQDAPISIDEIKRALQINTNAVDSVIHSGIVAVTMGMCPALWQRPDGATYTTSATAAEFHRAKLSVCRWCISQDDISRHTRLSYTHVFDVNSFDDLLCEVAA